ncbi:hypothetical protein [Flavitalea sp.]|nr:hypothetical protein [Flavitalea sp.]
MIEGIIKLPFDIPLLPVKSFKAGEINCLYENGNLRQISFCSEEIVQMIYPAVRGTNWETALSEIADEKINSYEKSFEISYTAIFRLNQIHYKSRITIIGKEDNSISFAMLGEALGKFETRRIGLCVHHPIKECKGKTVTITRPDKTSYTATYPYYVSPHQPFIDVQQMCWTNNQNQAIRLLFEGDVFETEDQRNWTDNSYKTYSTPLDRPSPVLVEKGAKLEQRVALRITKQEKPVNKISGSKIEMEEEKIPFPKIGYSRITGIKPLTNTEIDGLKNVPFDHYRVELLMPSLQWEEQLQVAISEAEKLNTSLELIAFFSNSAETEINQLVQQLIKYESRINSLLPLHIDHDITPVILIQSLYSRFKEVLPALKIGYGTNSFFAELNRNRPPSADFDFISFGFNPQVHATDTRTIIENLESQQQILESIRQFTSKPVHLSPVTFQQRTEAGKDPRLQTYFGAAWTLMSIKNLSIAGSITLYQTTGNRGIVANTVTATDNVSPLYEVLTQLKEFQPVYVVLNKNKDEIIFENKAGKRLTYSVRPGFTEI